MNQKSTDYTIPYRFSSESPPPPDRWCWVHGFIEGYGYNNPAQNKYVWARDVMRLLKRDLFKEFSGFVRKEIEEAETVALDALYEELKPLLEVELEERRKQCEERAKSPQFTKIMIPKINRTFPKLS